MRDQTMPMQIDMRPADPTADRGAFIGSILGCVPLFAALLGAAWLLGQ